MAVPTYTYGFDPADNPVDAVRLWVQDTGPNNNASPPAPTPNGWEFADQEIAYALTLYPNAILAAAWLAGTLAAKYAGLVDKSVGDLRIAYGQRWKAYQALVTTLKAQADSTGAGLYVGGVSKAEMERVASNSDKVEQPFRIKQFNIPGSADAAAVPGDDCE